MRHRHANISQKGRRSTAPQTNQKTTYLSNTGRLCCHPALPHTRAEAGGVLPQEVVNRSTPLCDASARSVVHERPLIDGIVI